MQLQKFGLTVAISFLAMVLNQGEALAQSRPTFTFKLTTGGKFTGTATLPSSIRTPSRCRVALFAKVVDNGQVVENAENTVVKTKAAGRTAVFQASKLKVVGLQNDGTAEPQVHMAVRVKCPGSKALFSKAYARQLSCTAGTDTTDAWFDTFLAKVK